MLNPQAQTFNYAPQNHFQSQPQPDQSLQTRSEYIDISESESSEDGERIEVDGDYEEGVPLVHIDACLLCDVRG